MLIKPEHKNDSRRLFIQKTIDGFFVFVDKIRAFTQDKRSFARLFDFLNQGEMALFFVFVIYINVTDDALATEELS